MFTLKCDCGNEANMIVNNGYILFNGINKHSKESPFYISGGYDGEIHIVCNKCKTTLDEDEVG